MTISETRKPRPARQTRLPLPSPSRLAASLEEDSSERSRLAITPDDKDKTFLYLAYGSNLCNETFRGRRGIKPLSQINVQVPELRVTFDLAGIPYLEPCFANTARRQHRDDAPTQLPLDAEIADLASSRWSEGGYRKDQWRKGLVGVVYEVTAEDYAHIIQTEGGGSSYQDILVDCHPIPGSDPAEPLPWHPTEPAFRAHTLFAPALPPHGPPSKGGGRVKRPDTSYAQASARYLKLMRDGAAELGLPYEYQEHLKSLRPYKITTVRQRIGQAAFLLVWLPVVALVFGLGKIFADDRGRLPGWLRRFGNAVFSAVWTSYDNVFKPLYGDGERTISDNIDLTGTEKGLSSGDMQEMSRLVDVGLSTELESISRQVSRSI